MVRGPLAATTNGVRGRAIVPGTIRASCAGVELARVVGHGLREQRVEQLDELLEPPGALAARAARTEHARVPALAARADTEHEAPARDVVQAHDVLGERHGVAEVRRRDPGAQPMRVGHRGGGGEQRHGGEPRLVGERRATPGGRRSTRGRSPAPRPGATVPRALAHRSCGSSTTPIRTMAARYLRVM